LKKQECVVLCCVVLCCVVLCCVVLCCVVWCVRLRDEQRLRAYEDSVLREVCASERGSNKEAGENCVVRSCLICAVRQVLLRSPGS
jgi:hypothetical protein